MQTLYASHSHHMNTNGLVLHVDTTDQNEKTKLQKSNEKKLYQSIKTFRKKNDTNLHRCIKNL